MRFRLTNSIMTRNSVASTPYRHRGRCPILAESTALLRFVDTPLAALGAPGPQRRAPAARAPQAPFLRTAPSYAAPRPRQRLAAAIVSAGTVAALFSAIAVSTVFVLRRKEPDTPRPYKTWGYPVVPAVFVLVAAVLLYFTFTQNLRNSLWGCGLILSGIPVFAYFARKKAQAG